jgi:hypothetical protein
MHGCRWDALFAFGSWGSMEQKTRFHSPSRITRKSNGHEVIGDSLGVQIASQANDQSQKPRTVMGNAMDRESHQSRNVPRRPVQSR